MSGTARQQAGGQPEGRKEEEEEEEGEEEEEVSVYDEIEIEDMTFDEALQIYHYPCPCGDRFEIALDDLRDEETDIAVCPSCSLMIRVIYDKDDLPKDPEPEPEGGPEAPKEEEAAASQVPVAA